MGYGLLIIGYALTFFLSLTLYGWVLRLLGFAIMAYGLFKLKDYFPSYKLALFTVIALFALGICEAGFEAATLFGAATEALEPIKTALLYLRDGVVFIFHILFLISTYIAFGVVGLNERRVSAVTDICAVTVGYIFYILSALGIIEANLSFLLQLVWTVMVFVLIFGCYMRICPEGDEDMPRKASRLPFVNRLSEALEKREREAAETARRAAEEKARASASVGRKKHKKRR